MFPNYLFFFRKTKLDSLSFLKTVEDDLREKESKTNESKKMIYNKMSMQIDKNNNHMKESSSKLKKSSQKFNNCLTKKENLKKKKYTDDLLKQIYEASLDSDKTKRLFENDFDDFTFVSTLFEQSQIFEFVTKFSDLSKDDFSLFSSFPQNSFFDWKESKLQNIQNVLLFIFIFIYFYSFLFYFILFLFLIFYFYIYFIFYFYIYFIF